MKTYIPLLFLLLALLAVPLAIFSFKNTTPPDYIVTNVNDSGIGSLRQAILDANADPGPDTIEFDIPGNPPHTLRPVSNFPDIVDPVTLDGYSQSGSAEATGSDVATLRIELDGQDNSEGVGLTLAPGSDESLIKGLAIHGFRTGIKITGSSRNHIEGNYLGTDCTGKTDRGIEMEGITLQEGAAYNRIGGTTPAERNIISENGNDELYDGHGIFITGIHTSHNEVTGNYIGTDPTGTQGRGNSKHGILIADGAHHNTIGGTVGIDPRSSCTGACNLISDNGIAGGWGVNIGTLSDSPSPHHNLITGNFLGTDVTGNYDLGNDNTGVTILFGGTENTIHNNLISGNDVQGIAIESEGTVGNVITGNYIGTNAAGTAAIPNPNGVALLWHTSGTIVGGTTEEERNVISGNAWDGIRIAGNYPDDPKFVAAPPSNNIVKGNYIGTTADGLGTLGNGEWGIRICFGANHNTVGGPAEEDRNIIAYNGQGGLSIGEIDRSGIVPADNLVQGNRIHHNAGSGILLGGDSADNEIRNNTIYENSGAGIVTVETVLTSHESDNRIVENESYDNGGEELHVGREGS